MNTIRKEATLEDVQSTNKDQVKENSKCTRSKTFSRTSRETRIRQECKGNVPGGKFGEVTWAGPWNAICYIKVFGF